MQQLILCAECDTHAAKLSSDLFAGFWSGKLVCIWGLIPPTLLSSSAYLWLITTPEAKTHWLAFARRSRQAVQNMLKLYPIIYGTCLEPNAKDWLQWLGAQFNGSTFILRDR